MPYFITDDAEGCSGWATIKEDGEVIGCHNTKQDAIDQMVAVSIAEDIQVGGERKKKKKPMQYRALPENYRSALEDDVPEGRACGNCLFFNEAKQITEDGLRKAWCERWDDYAQGGFYCNAWQPKKGELRAPAPASDQIEGSDENKPGSAQGAGGDIDFDEKTETALKNKVSDHNDQMAEQEKPTWTRTTLGQLKAVYRRGSGAYSTSHRPGVSRAAWSMARVNAYLYLLRNGRPENPAYTTDFDLLPEGHPKSTRKFTFLGLEHRQVDFSVPDYIQENAAQGLRWHRKGLSGSGLVERTVREAAAMARGEITENKVRRMAAWFARHMSDLSAPSAKPDHPDYPSPGVVAHALWGGGNRNQSERAMAWAEAKVKALDSEQRHGSHDQLSHGRPGRSNPGGGNGLTTKQLLEGGSAPDLTVKKVYAAEEKVNPSYQRDGEKPFMKGRENFETTEDYKNAYKEYDKKFTEYYVERTKNIKSKLGEKHLDGSKKGIQNYVNETTKEEWFIEAFGNDNLIETPKVSVVESQKFAGRYSIGIKNGKPISNLAVNKYYSKTEPVVIHEIAHYATFISAKPGIAGHGSEFIQNHLFIASKIVGEGYASELEAAYKAEGVKVGE